MSVPFPGTRWRHYKGGEYTVVNVAVHTETEEVMVVYQDATQATWARPLSMWNQEVSPGVPRFTLVTLSTLKS
jgi:hypothetical protein